MQAQGRRLEREHNERAWLVWHVAKLMRAKKIPELKVLLAKRVTPRERQSPEHQMMIMNQWVHATRHFPRSKAMN